MAVLSDFINRGHFRKSWSIRIFLAFAFGRAWCLAAPSVIGTCDFGNIVIRQVPMTAVDHRSHIAGIDKENLAAPVAELVVFLEVGDKPETDPDHHVLK